MKLTQRGRTLAHEIAGPRVGRMNSRECMRVLFKYGRFTMDMGPPPWDGRAELRRLWLDNVIGRILLARVEHWEAKRRLRSAH